LMIRALIAGRCRVHLDALAAALSQGHRVHVLGTASNRDEVLARVRDVPPDIVLIDATMTDAANIVSGVRNHAKGVKVVVITEGETEAEITRLAEAGVAGYVLPEGSLDDLVIAIHSAVRGELYCPPRVAFNLLRRVGALAAALGQDVTADAHSPIATLTRREREILALVDQGMSNRAIAKQLGIQPTTAKNHVHNILEKLHVHRRIDASTWYRRGGFHLKLEA
jgi:two-component system, NarL family, nitrate/nitrite response regulator NarL